MKRKMIFAAFAVIGFFLVFTMAGCTVTEPELRVLAEERGQYPDGRYRGTFHDRGYQQVGIQFYLDENHIYDLSFRVLNYGGNDFLDPDNPDNDWEQEDVENLAGQYEQLLQWLEGRKISDIGILIDAPETAAVDVAGSGEVHGVDAWTAATMRGTKITSAIRDGLNRGTY